MGTDREEASLLGIVLFENPYISTTSGNLSILYDDFNGVRQIELKNTNTLIKLRDEINTILMERGL